MKSLVKIVLLLYFGSCSLTVSAYSYSNSIKDRACGIVVSENPIHQHPWLVFLEYHLGHLKASIRCGGTLIDSRHILTSAHCVEIVKNIPELSGSVTILPRLGEYNMSSRRDCVAGVCSDRVVRMAVDSIYLHPRFYHDNVSHDLAMLVLEADAPYTDFIRPICLPSRSSGPPTVLYASGFGNTPNSIIPTQIKKNIRLPYYSKCPKNYEKIYNLPEDGFCAGGIEHIDTCTGDSGGPAVRYREIGGIKTAELYGVIKGGTKGCGLKGQPGVYISVLQNLLWITNIIKITSPKHQNNETKSEKTDNGANESRENKDREKENGKKQNEDKQDEGKVSDVSQNGGKLDKGKHKDDYNSGHMHFGLGYLLILMIVLGLYCFSMYLFWDSHVAQAQDVINMEYGSSTDLLG